MVRRLLSDDERALFEQIMSGAAPLKKSPRPRKKAAPSKAPGQEQPPDTKKHHPEPVRTPRTHERRTPGIDGNTAERMRRGLLEPQARLDLHGLSERDAHRALLTFVRAAHLRKFRLLLVVTGKGGAERGSGSETVFDLGLDMRARGILRSLAPRWLRESGLVEFVADVREAHRRHGGSGALYVYLRKGGQR